MKDKNLPPDNETQSLDELTNAANNIIEKKFRNNSKKINDETKKKINNIMRKKNAK
jgi:hypothetical protein